MELHERQQFDFLLQTAVERYVERLEQRNEGAPLALERLTANAQGPSVRLAQFVDALFDDFLLANAEGACFVLRALAARPLPAPGGIPTGPRIDAALVSLAKAAFADLLLLKTTECLEQHAGYQAVNTTATGGR